MEERYGRSNALMAVSTSVERFFENGIEFFIYEAEKKDKVFSFQKN